MKGKYLTTLHKLQSKCKYGCIITSNPHKRRLATIKEYMKDCFCNTKKDIIYNNIIKYDELYIIRMYAFHQVDYIEMVDYDIESLIERAYAYLLARS